MCALVFALFFPRADEWRHLCAPLVIASLSPRRGHQPPRKAPMTSALTSALMDGVAFFLIVLAAFGIYFLMEGE